MQKNQKRPELYFIVIICNIAVSSGIALLYEKYSIHKKLFVGEGWREGATVYWGEHSFHIKTSTLYLQFYVWLLYAW